MEYENQEKENNTTLQQIEKMKEAYKIKSKIRKDTHDKKLNVLKRKYHQEQLKKKKEEKNFRINVVMMLGDGLIKRYLTNHNNQVDLNKCISLFDELKLKNHERYKVCIYLEKLFKTKFNFNNKATHILYKEALTEYRNQKKQTNNAPETEENLKTKNPWGFKRNQTKQ